MRSVNEWALTLRIAFPRNTQCFTAIVQTITEIWRYWEYWEFGDYVPDPVRSYYNYVHLRLYFVANCRLSRVCAVAHNAVLETNGKVNGIGEILHPYSSETLGLIWMLLQTYHYIRPGSRYAEFD